MKREVSTPPSKALGPHQVKNLHELQSLLQLLKDSDLGMFIPVGASVCLFAWRACLDSGTCVLNDWVVLSLYYLEGMIYFHRSHYKILPVSYPTRLRLSNKLTVTENCMQ